MTAHQSWDRFEGAPLPSGTARRTEAAAPSILTVDIRDLFRMAGRRKRWLILPALLLPLVALAVALALPPRFEATAQLLIDPRGLQVIENELTPSTQVSEASMAVVESQMRVITSERVLRALVEAENLAADPEFTDPFDLKSFLLGPLQALVLPAQPEAPPALRALRTLQSRVGTRRGEKSYIVDVTVETRDRQKSVRLANALASLYIESEFSARSEAARKIGASLGARLGELREEVRLAEEKVEAFKARSNIVGAAGRLVSDQQLSELNAQLVAARARTAELRVRTEQIERARRAGGSSDAISEAVQSPTIATLRSQLAEVRRRQSDASTFYGPRHPDIAVMEGQVRTYERQIRDELARIAQAARADYDRARANEDALARNLESLKNGTIETSKAFVRLRELEREVETTRNVYEAFLRRTKEVTEQQTVDTANARIISRAVPAARANGPSLSTILLGAAAAGLAFGAAAGLLRDQVASPVRSRRHLAGTLGLPVLASVPDFRPARDRASGAGRGGSALELLARAAPDSRAAMALRPLAEIASRPRPDGAPTAVLVASPGANRPLPSVPALALGRALAGDGRRVLLVDARPPALRARPKAGRLGLTDVVTGRASLADAVVAEAGTGIGWLPAGTGAGGTWPNAAELRRALLGPESGFDVLVFDGGSLVTDALAAAILELADHVVLSVEEGVTATDTVEDEAEALGQHSAKLRGLVLTTGAR